MAEGTQPELEAVDLLEESKEPAGLATTTPEMTSLSLGPDVRPKEKAALATTEQEASEMAEKPLLLPGQTGVGEDLWSGLLRPGECCNHQHVPLVLTPSRNHFTQWREICISEDEWSYSTALGSQTLEVLREMFGPAGFQAPGTGMGWQRTREPPPGHGSGGPSIHLSAGGVDQDYSAERGRRDEPMACRPPADPPVVNQWMPYTDPDTARYLGQEYRTPIQSWAVRGPGQGSLGKWDPPTLKASFDGNAEKMALFMGQVIDHLDTSIHLSMGYGNGCGGSHGRRGI